MYLYGILKNTKKQNKKKQQKNKKNTNMKFHTYDVDHLELWVWYVNKRAGWVEWLSNTRFIIYLIHIYLYPGLEVLF